jgi:hypothetical protein
MMKTYPNVYADNSQSIGRTPLLHVIGQRRRRVAAGEAPEIVQRGALAGLLGAGEVALRGEVRALLLLALERRVAHPLLAVVVGQVEIQIPVERPRSLLQEAALALDVLGVEQEIRVVLERQPHRLGESDPPFAIFELRWLVPLRVRERRRRSGAGERNSHDPADPLSGVHHRIPPRRRSGDA